MKKIIALSLVFIYFNASAQTNKELFGIKIGYGTTAINFKESNPVSFSFFGRKFDSGNTFSGDGIEFGVTRSINKKMFMDFSFASFSEDGLHFKVNDFEYLYKINGYQIPISINYLLRNEERKFQFVIGLGFQYLHSKLKEQQHYISADQKYIENEFDEIKISEASVIFGAGIQYRIVPYLLAAFNVKASLSTRGRYSDRPSISLMYVFQK